MHIATLCTSIVSVSSDKKEIQLKARKSGKTPSPICFWKIGEQWKPILYSYPFALWSIHSCWCSLLPRNTSPQAHILPPDGKGSLDYVEKTSESKLILKQLGTKSRERGKSREGVKNHHPWGSSPAAAYCHDACSNTNTLRRKQTCATVDPTMPNSLAVNHAAQPSQRGSMAGRKSTKGEQDDGGLLTIINKSRYLCAFVGLYPKQWRVNKHESYQERFLPLFLLQLPELSFSVFRAECLLISQRLKRWAGGRPVTHTHTLKRSIHPRTRTWFPDTDTQTGSLHVYTKTDFLSLMSKVS